MTQLEHVRVGPFAVADLPSDRIVTTIVERAVSQAGVRPTPVFALHVGGLNSRRDTEFQSAMRVADLVYADGMSIVLLARLAGARQIQRAGTTDIGWDLLQALSQALGRPARVALLGGVAGLTDRAGHVLADQLGVEVVATVHGYHEDWAEPLAAVSGSGCDVVVVGLGAPYEMKWVQTHLAHLPPALVVTCGGWFGFIVQEEERAPQWMQRAGLEWAYRVKQAPRRLGSRYARGVASTAAVGAAVIARRVAPRARRP